MTGVTVIFTSVKRCRIPFSKYTKIFFIFYENQIIVYRSINKYFKQQTNEIESLIKWKKKNKIIKQLNSSSSIYNFTFMERSYFIVKLYSFPKIAYFHTPLVIQDI